MEAIITKEKLHRFTGILLIIAGSLYILVQFIHPADAIESVNTAAWFWVGVLSIVMSLFTVIGLWGVYSRQVRAAGIIGLIGFLLVAIFWLLSFVFGFIETFVLPQLAAAYPAYVEGMVGLFSDVVSTVDLGVFPILTAMAGVFYILGGLLFGFASAKAEVYPKYLGWLLAVASLLTIAASFIPHPADRMFAIPMGLALILYGYYSFAMEWQVSK